jgi:3-mercaptopyruvate sulfurtransferase SseA
VPLTISTIFSLHFSSPIFVRCTNMLRASCVVALSAVAARTSRIYAGAWMEMTEDVTQLKYMMS